MEIICYTTEYAKQITDLYHDTIHSIASADYTRAELDVWAPTPPDYSAWKIRLESKRPFLAVDNNTLLGFAELENKGHIDCFYVHKHHQGRGIGRLLMQHIRDTAIKREYTSLFAEVSITAKPFFLKMGFAAIRPNLVTFGAYMLKNYLMAKKLG